MCLWTGAGNWQPAEASSFHPYYHIAHLNNSKKFFMGQPFNNKIAMYLTVPTDDLCPEPFSKKPKSFRPNLQLDDSDRGSVESPRIKAIKSAQNCTAKKFVFPTG